MSNRRTQPNFEQINRWQDRKQAEQRDAVAILQARAEHSATRFVAANAEEAAWVDTYHEQIANMNSVEQKDRTTYNQFLDRAVLPRYTAYVVNDLLGRNNQTSKIKGRGFLDDKTFNVVGITKELECTRREATAITAFGAMLNMRSDLKNIIEGKTWFTSNFAEGVNLADLQALFKSPEFLDRLIVESFRRAAPVLDRESNIDGVISIAKKTSVYMGDNESALQLLRDHFATEDRRQVIVERMQAGDESVRYSSLDAYEVLFGEISKEEFLQLFPDWESAKSFRTYKYEQRFGLQRTKEPEPEVVVPPEVQPEEDTSEEITEEDEEHEAEIKPTPLPTQKPNPFLRRARTAAVALMSVAVLGGLVAKKAFETDGAAAEDDVPADIEDETQRFTSVPQMGQTESTYANNLSAEGREPTGENPNFFCLPACDFMRTTEVFTTISNRAGKLLFEPDLAFHHDPATITDENATRYTIGERIAAQGTILYPPEIGKIELESIVVDGLSRNDFTVTQGALGEYSVILNNPPAQPFIVVYEVLSIAGNSDSVPYFSEIPDVPEVGNTVLENIHVQLDLIRQPDETDTEFAFRAQDTVRDAFDYPTTEFEKELSFTEAIEARVGDCDVANSVLLAVLHSNQIPAEMIGDIHPVPGRDKHGQIRVLVDGTVQVLNATPTTRSSRSERSRSVAQASSRDRSTTSAAPETNSTRSRSADKEPTPEPVIDPQLETLQAAVNSYCQRDTGERSDASAEPIILSEEGATMAQDESMRSETTQESVPEPSVPESTHAGVTSEPEPEARPADVEALQRGVWGFVEHRIQLIHPEQDIDLSVDVVWDGIAQVVYELENANVIPHTTDTSTPAAIDDWSRTITAADAEEISTTLHAYEFVSAGGGRYYDLIPTESK